ncbi:MAG: GtrA family protein [Prevotella sp.]|jgi:putative flippase GtrA|nr:MULTISPECIES: GtrA family protein [unclassified Prevotella]MCH3969974.1 GtrA family protein [Prevotella sp.]MCH3984674.1 GtrA family protein [Prevotella sp.]MCH3991280.1 GtrA family protein [Prevotella sp.]MCH4018454.1 GtrA family protein [Prevotella sp.]MCH4100449.1 GtrA family protein [Prevotella sp.]
MGVKDKLDLLKRKEHKNLDQMMRFCVVGLIATLIQYGIYWILIHLMGISGHIHVWSTIAMTIAYLASFVFNFFASTRFTFHVRANAKRGAGFLFSHVVNYFLQMITFNFFLWIGMGRLWAPIPMFCICVPTNFLLVRFFLTRI